VDFTVDAGWDQVPLYGAGCSEKLVYYIDTDRIRSMILPNDYNMGYQAMNSISDKLNNRLNALEQQTISYSVVNKANLFRKENQQILFPVEQ
jgi:ribose transport system substrate-binding protein